MQMLGMIDVNGIILDFVHISPVTVWLASTASIWLGISPLRYMFFNLEPRCLKFSAFTYITVRSRHCPNQRHLQYPLLPAKY